MTKNEFKEMYNEYFKNNLGITFEEYKSLSYYNRKLIIEVKNKTKIKNKSIHFK